MIRPKLVLSVAVALALTGGVSASPSRAEPPPPCSFTLSPPQLVQISGVDMVSATLAPAGCGPMAGPYLSVACLQIQDGDSSTQCMQAHGTDPAQVYYTPYRPGATYASTGRGCASWLGQPPAPLCQLLGPYTATV